MLSWTQTSSHAVETMSTQALHLLQCWPSSRQLPPVPIPTDRSRQNLSTYTYTCVRQLLLLFPFPSYYHKYSRSLNCYFVIHSHPISISYHSHSKDKRLTKHWNHPFNFFVQKITDVRIKRLRRLNYCEKLPENRYFIFIRHMKDKIMSYDVSRDSRICLHSGKCTTRPSVLYQSINKCQSSKKLGGSQFKPRLHQMCVYVCLHIFNLVCVFYYFIWAVLPEIKRDDDDDTCSRLQVSRTSNLYPDTSGYNLYPG